MGTGIHIFDTTLRDGEQSPGFSMTVAEKLRVARQLERLGVDVIEAGFPASSPSDFAAVTQIAAEIRGPVICGLARAIPSDIEAAYNAVKGAAHPRIHTFIATSPIHMEKKLNMKPDEVLRRAVDAVTLAKSFGVEVQFALEDALRTEPAFAVAVSRAVIAAGATIVNIPDTVGYTSPQEMYNLIRHLIDHVQPPDGVIFACHCHNDLGMAVANSLAAVEAGCRQVEGTINGIGERAGNAALEEVVMMLRTRHDRYPYETNIVTQELFPTSKLLQTVSGIPVQPNKAVVGANAFAHEAGIHQDGMLKDRLTYEIMRPQDVGLPESVLVLGKHSGRRAVKDKLERMGYRLSDSELDRLFVDFKALADQKKYVTDDDLEAMVAENHQNLSSDLFVLNTFQVVCGSGAVPTATVRLSTGPASVRQEAASGCGPMEALFKAIDRAAAFSGELLDYQVRTLTSGMSGAAEVSVRVGWRTQAAAGRGVSTDLLEASARAYVSALNRLAMGAHAHDEVAASGEWMDHIFKD